MAEKRLLELSEELDYDALEYLSKHNVKFKALSSGTYKKQFDQLLRKKYDQLLLSIVRLGEFDENLLYEVSQNLGLDELRKLCSTNRKMRTICQIKRFQELIQRKTQEKNEEDKYYQQLVEKIYNEIPPYGGFQYYIVTTEDQYGGLLDYHSISYDHSRKGNYLSEHINMDAKLYSHADNNILGRLYGGLIYDEGYQSAYRVNNVTPEQVKKVLNILVRRPDFNINQIGYRVPNRY